LKLKILGERIKNVRNEKKLTLESFSEQVGISRNFLWEIEAGRKAPAINTLYMISKELNVSLDYLFGYTDKIKWLSDDKKDYNEFNDIIKALDTKEKDLLFKMIKIYLEDK